jgi:hypothetical protein
VGQLLTVLLSIAVLLSGAAELVPHSWCQAAGILRILALVNWAVCAIVLLLARLG